MAVDKIRLTLLNQCYCMKKRADVEKHSSGINPLQLDGSYNRKAYRTMQRHKNKF